MAKGPYYGLYNMCGHQSLGSEAQMDFLVGSQAYLPNHPRYEITAAEVKISSSKRQPPGTS